VLVHFEVGDRSSFEDRNDEPPAVFLRMIVLATERLDALKSPMRGSVAVLLIEAELPTPALLAQLDYALGGRG
jgi:hypothetical protein